MGGDLAYHTYWCCVSGWCRFRTSDGFAACRISHLSGAPPALIGGGYKSLALYLSIEPLVHIHIHTSLSSRGTPLSRAPSVLDVCFR